MPPQEVPTSKSAYHHGDVPGAILTAALGLIRLHGVEGFSLREAAVAIGVSPSAVYRHFTDKADLLAALSREGFAELSQRFESAMAQAAQGDPATTARARLAAQGEAYVAFALEHPERFQVMFGRYGRGTREQPTDRPSPFQMLGQALDALGEAGVISQAARVGAEVPVWAAIHGLACLLVAGALGGADPALLTRQVNQSILAALAGA